MQENALNRESWHGFPAAFHRLLRRIHANPTPAPPATMAMAAGPVSPIGGPSGCMVATYEGCVVHGSCIMGLRVPRPGVAGVLVGNAMVEGAACSNAQEEEQPSPLRRLPSSQDSVGSMMRSPQRGAKQSGRHMAPGVARLCSAPASHSSPRSSRPSPQVFERLLHVAGLQT